MPERPTLQAVLDLFETHVPEDAKAWIEDVASSKKLTRTAFFDAAYWAILVANMNVATVRTWVDKASACGFPFDWRELGKWNDDDGQFDAWCKRMAKQLENPKDDLEDTFRDRWWAIWDAGWRLAQFESGAAFRKHYFNGKKHGRELTNEDVQRLLEIKRTDGALHRIGEVSVPFILRNLGGNFLKPDTWITAFADWYGYADVSELASALSSADIHCGKFDSYCWEYCSSHLRRAADLPEHFDQLFSI